jgi:hypothetical protein
LVEQRTENPRVGGSIPPLATISIQSVMVIFPVRPKVKDGRGAYLVPERLPLRLQPSLGTIPARRR